MKKKILIYILLLSVASCKPNIEQLKKEIMQVDIDFSNRSIEKGMHSAFLEYIDNNGVILRDNSMPIIGRDTIAKIYSLKSDTNFVLEWKPLYADIAKSGEIGYTYGIWTLTADTNKFQGTYVTIWKKNKDGKWKFVLDTGNDGLK